MTLSQAMVEMVEGNPGALVVCMRLIKEGGEIDPDSLVGGFANVLDLDTLGVYGPRIWMLYKDVCKEDLTKTVGLLRAWQLGIVTEAALHRAIDNYGEGLDLDATMAKVKEQLPNFKA